LSSLSRLHGKFMCIELYGRLCVLSLHGKFMCIELLSLWEVYALIIEFIELYGKFKHIEFIWTVYVY
jgi:hypothetical protein